MLPKNINLLTQIYNSLRAKPFLSSLLISASFFFIFFVFLEPSFEENDDVQMMFISNGFAYQQPLEYLVFTNFIIGLILKSLYNTLPEIPWYGLYLYSLIFIALVIILYVSIKCSGSIIKFVIMSYTILFFVTRIMMRLQFTSTAFFIGIAFLAYYLFLTPSRSRINNLIIVILGVFLGAISLIRTSSFVGIFLWSVPLFIYSLRYIHIKKHILFAMSAIIIFSSFNYLNNVYYLKSSPNWQDYFNFLPPLALVLITADKIPDSELKDALEKVNWSDNDYLMLNYWFYTDTRVFSTENLQNFSDSRPIKISLWQGLKNTFKNLREEWLLEIKYLALLSIFLMLFAPKQRLFFTFFIFWQFSIMYYLINYQYFPFRVAESMFAFTAFFLILCAELSPFIKIGKKIILRINEHLIVTCLIMLAVLSTPNAIKSLRYESNRNHILSNQLIETLQEMYNLNKSGIFIQQASALNWRKLSPFVSKQDLPKLNFIWLAWQINSPPYLELLQKLKIDDLPSAIATRKDIYLITSEPYLSYYQKYMQEHYNQDVKMESILTINPKSKTKIFKSLSPKSS
jgi:hypothetical protein